MQGRTQAPLQLHKAHDAAGHSPRCIDLTDNEARHCAQTGQVTQQLHGALEAHGKVTSCLLICFMGNQRPGFSQATAVLCAEPASALQQHEAYWRHPAT